MPPWPLPLPPPDGAPPPVAGCGGCAYSVGLLPVLPLLPLLPEFPELPLLPEPLPREPVAECGPKYAVPCQ